MDNPNVTYNISGNNISNANFGTQTGNITSSMNVAAQFPKGPEFAKAMKSVVEAVLNAPDLKEDQKREVLESLEAVGAEAEKPEDKRKTGVLKPVLTSIPQALASAVSLSTLWHTYGPAITGFFGM